MNQAGIKRTTVYAGAAAFILMFTGTLTATAFSLAAAEAGSGGWLAGTIIKIVHLFIKLVLLVA